jgi:hypothetical protein
MHASHYFGKSAEEVSRYFKIVDGRNSQPAFSERQKNDAAEDARRDLKVPCIAVRPGPVFALWNKYCRNQGLELVLSQGDLLAELKVCPFFVPGPRQGHQYKFGRGAKSNSYCWLIDLAKFDEFGLRDVSDEAWEKSFYHDEDPAKGVIPMDEWVDPRKGELFGIVDALKEAKE